MSGPILDQINVVARDVEQSAAFYRALGVEMNEPARNAASEPFHCSGKPGEGALLEIDSTGFARVWNSGWAGADELAGRVVIGLRVSDRESVDRLFASVTAMGHRGLQRPIDAFWGARYAIVEDPNGVAVGLMSPADDCHRSHPPSF